MTLKTVKKDFALLSDLVKISKGKKYDEVPAGKHRYITIEDLHRGDYSKYTDDNGVTCETNDVLIAWDGANAGKVGTGLSGVIGSTLAKLVLTDKRVDSTFLYWYLEAKLEDIKSQRTGATIPHVNGTVLKKMEIPLIPLSSQKRIAKILNQTKILRKKNEQLLQYYDNLAQSLFIDMFGNSAINSAWKTFTIEQLAKSSKGSMRTGPFGSDLLHSEFVETGVFVLGIDNVVNNSFEWAKNRFITEEKYEKLKRYTVYPGDVLISIMGTTGKCAIVPNNISRAINSKHLAAISPNQELVLPEFLCFSIHSDPTVIKQLLMKNKGAIMDGLNLGVIKQIELKLPPLKQQLHFSNILRNIEEQKKKLKQQMQESENLYHTLLQKAFNGDLN